MGITDQPQSASDGDDPSQGLLARQEQAFPRWAAGRTRPISRQAVVPAPAGEYNFGHVLSDPTALNFYQQGAAHDAQVLSIRHSLAAGRRRHRGPGPAPPTAAAAAKKAENSLTLVPANAAFYGAMFRSGAQVEAVAKSKAWAIADPAAARSNGRGGGPGAARQPRPADGGHPQAL